LDWMAGWVGYLKAVGLTIVEPVLRGSKPEADPKTP